MSYYSSSRNRPYSGARGRYNSRNRYRGSSRKNTYGGMANRSQAGRLLTVLNTNPVLSNCLAVGLYGSLGSTVLGSLTTSGTTLTGFDAQIRGGFTEFGFSAQPGKAIDVILVEYLAEPGESAPSSYSGAWFYNKMMKKQIIGMTEVVIPGPPTGAQGMVEKRLGLSKVTILQVSGYSYVIQAFSRRVTAAGDFTWGLTDARIKWDKVV